MLTDIVNKLVEYWKNEYEIVPYDINNGECDEFAMDVIKIAEKEGIEVADVCVESFVGHDTELPGHFWVYCIEDDKHYDAECPEGVLDWFDLPIFIEYDSFLFLKIGE